MSKQDISKFEDALLKAYGLLQQFGQPAWAKRIYEIGGQLQEGHWDAANTFLRIYGGSGGFGEVYLSANGVPLSSENTELDALKDELFVLARSIKNRGPG
ncbi:hypothetical protein Rfer_4470 (plasmid) [Rhodoferax ferrireducens T118]|uniref:Uncharacterized protein n=1 Tax=Albidiferax ferrireducens (strain ATCC BAA-621 / DSM 15236 / T118) TaxID=338969 RepID=Q21PY9_ALBFT|nr:hypothetical protein [Rhodoferax ferrireducens]ABD72156.1 hypothetical protein Rfer_4470 [Rhodoferax ferrireducens T118]